MVQHTDCQMQRYSEQSSASSIQGSEGAVIPPEVVGHGHVWRKACGGLLCEEANSCGLPNVAVSTGKRQGARDQVQESALASTIRPNNPNPLSREEFVPEVAA